MNKYMSTIIYAALPVTEKYNYPSYRITVIITMLGVYAPISYIDVLTCIMIYVLITYQIYDRLSICLINQTTN